MSYLLNIPGNLMICCPSKRRGGTNKKRTC